MNHTLERQSTPDRSKNHETFQPHTLGIATSTFYPTWSANTSTVNNEPSSDKIRGDLALETIRTAIDCGYQIAVVDGGSTLAFQEALQSTGAILETERERGMSASRRQAFEAVSGTDGIKIICWTEPEKISMVRDCMELAVQPIVDGTADIVIPKRGSESFATYPNYQVEFETSSNKHWNNALRRHGLLDEGAEDLDGWIGPRVFRNDPEIVELFMDKYRYTTDNLSNQKQYDPELWPNAIFLPVVAALEKGYRVASVDVPYRHPAEQTRNEQNSPLFEEKRAKQQRNILTATAQFLRYKEARPRTHIEKF